MHYRTSHYRTKIQLHGISRKKNKKTNQRPKNDLEWLAAQFSIISLALVELQLGYVEHYPCPVRTLRKQEKNEASGDVSQNINHRKWFY